MLLIRVCQWIKLRIQLVTKVPVEVIRAGFRKGDKPSSKIPGMFKGQLYQLSFKLIRSANHPPMLPSSTLRNLLHEKRHLFREVFIRLAKFIIRLPEFLIGQPIRPRFDATGNYSQP